MSLAATLGSRFVLLVTGRLVLLLIGFVVTAVLTRQLGPTGFGHYRAAVAYLGLFVVLADFGLNSIFVREISKQGADQERIVGGALALRLLISVVVFGFAVLLTLTTSLEPQARLGILAGTLGFVAYSVHLFLFGLFQQRLRQQGAIVAEVAGGIVLLAVVAAASVADLQPYWFVAALGLSYTVTLAISLVFARRLLHFRLRIDAAQWRALLGAALSLAGVTALSVLYMRMDSVMLALLQPAEAVGLYGVPIKISDGANGIVLLTIGLFVPLVARAASENMAGFVSHLEDALGVVVMAAVAGALLLNVLAVEIVTLLGGADYEAAAPILQLLTIQIVMHSITMMMRESAVALRVQHQLLTGYIVGAIVAMAAFLILIPMYSGIGATASLIIAETLILGSVIRVVNRNSPVSISTFRIPLGAIGCGIAVWLATSLVAVDWSWILRSVWSLALYLVLLLLTRTLRVRELLTFGRELLSRTPEPDMTKLNPTE